MFSGIIQGIGSIQDSSNNEYTIKTDLDFSRQILYPIWVFRDLHMRVPY